MTEPTQKAPRKKAAPPAAIPVGSLERFVTEKVHRRQLKNAPYNPRVITDEERAKLSAIIAEHGLVAPQTWNRRTGNIVSGHQRTAACDALYGTDDYELTVAVIDVDEVREKELNIGLNNVGAQGSFDMAALEQLLKDTPTINIEASGFSGDDVFKLFGASPFEERVDDALTEAAQRIRDARERQAKIKGKAKVSDQQSDYYVVVVFASNDDRFAFADKVGWDDNRYQDGRQLEKMCAPWIKYIEGRKAGTGAPTPAAQETTSEPAHAPSSATPAADATPAPAGAPPAASPARRRKRRVDQPPALDGDDPDDDPASE